MMALTCLLLFTAACVSRGDMTVPNAPTAVSLHPVSQESLLVEWSPPVSDGGSMVTSYTVEWDTNPGVPEIQEIRTQTYTNANEVQTISTTFEEAEMEIQTVSTSSTFLPAIQSVTTSANPENVLSGEFTLELDLRPLGGSKELSGILQHDASAEDMVSVLQSMQNVNGAVEVERSDDADDEGGYTWLITFTGGVITEQLADKSLVIHHGVMPLLDVAEFALGGTGAAIATDTVRHGNEVSGEFELEFNGACARP